MLSLYLHSIIDFDFSLSAVYLLAWILTGFISAFYVEYAENLKFNNDILNITSMFISGILALVLIISGFNMVQGLNVLREREKISPEVKQSDIKTVIPQMISIYDRYLMFQPHDEEQRTEYISFLSRIREYVSEQDKDLKGSIENKIYENIQKSMENEPESYKTLIQAAQFNVLSAHFEDAIAFAQKAVESARFVGGAYNDEANIYLWSGINAINMGKSQNNKDLVQAGKSYLEKVVNIRQEINAASEKSLKPIQVSPTIDTIIKQAKDRLAQE